MKITHLLVLLLFSVSSLRSEEVEKEEAPKQAEVPYKYEWLDWKPGLFESYRKKGRVVWLSFRADWCLLCVQNEKRAFSHKGVLDEFEKHRVVLIRADLTKRDPKIVKEMKKLGLTNVPANLIGTPNLKAAVIRVPEVFGPDDAMKALEQAVAESK